VTKPEAFIYVKYYAALFLLRWRGNPMELNVIIL